jgi:chorismate synthase
MQVILEGLPAGFPLNIEAMNHELARRQMGYGRGGRMKIETDVVRVLSGMRHGLTLGSPLTLQVLNLDHTNWADRMSPEPVAPENQGAKVRIPRPGHADLAGAEKYGFEDLRNVLERASARETVNRVLLGAVAQQFLAHFDVQLASHVVAIGGVKSDASFDPALSLKEQNQALDQTSLRCLSEENTTHMMECIDDASHQGDTLGGVVEVVTTPLPVGLGSHVHWDRRLDARLGAALLSLPSAKGIELGSAFEQAAQSGRTAHDALYPSNQFGYKRLTNHAGGLEGGMSNGEPLCLRVAFKPLPTLAKPLDSIDLDTGEAAGAHRERSDVCALAPASVIAEAAVAWVLFEACMETYGADRFDQLLERFQARRSTSS